MKRAAELLLTPEQRELRTAVRAFLDQNSPMERVRTVMESDDGYDRALYARMAAELGLPGLIIPEPYGGAGAGYAELAVVLEELGAALLPGPFLATTFATIALTEAMVKTGGGSEGQGGGKSTHLPEIAAGRTVATLAIGGVAMYGADSDLVLTGDGGRLRGAEAAGASRTPLEGLDPTRRQARVTLTGPADLGEVGARTWDLVAVALAAEQLGVMRRALETIVAYSRERHAFGRAVGSYQGVKHRLADMHCKLEQAESIVRHAAWAADAAAGELPAAAALAQAYVGRSCFEVAQDHLLLHGGIGFTWEHDAHLYLKRAKADEVLLGPPREHRNRLASLILS